MAQSVTKEDPKLGQWLTITAVLRKSHNRIDEKTTWTAEPITPKQAMFIGVRYVNEGYWNWTMTEDGPERTYFKREQTHRVWLFVLDTHRNPVYVHPDNVADYVENEANHAVV